jgi:CheY-like chemotaxis protein
MYGLLIVDDNALVRMTLSMSVDWRKWNVELVGMAHDGEEALRFCEEHHPDIVITDIKMPGKDGIYLMEHLSKKSPEIQMIAVSDAGVFEHAKLAMIYGCINYLLKPVKAEELNDSVRRAVTNIQRSRIGDDDLFDFYEHALMSNSSLVENMDIFFIVGKKLPSMDTLYEQVEGIERNYLFQFSSHNLQIILGAIECLNDTSMSNMREVLEFNKTRLFILRKIDKSCTIEKMDQIYRESLKQLSLKIYWCRKPFHGTRRLDAGDWGKNLNLLYSLADDEGMLRILLERLNASTSEDFQSMETNRKIITDYLKHLALLSIRRFDDVYQLLTMMDNQQKIFNNWSFLSVRMD